MDESISPYLSAVQKLKGRTPGEKYRELNRIAKEIAEQSIEKHVIANLDQVTPPLVPLVQILVAKRLEFPQYVVDGLASDDSVIVNQALSAKFYFDEKNPLLSVESVRDQILPQVSLRTRAKLIKILSVCLAGNELKAQDFYQLFVDLYGVSEAMPLLMACSKEFIFDNIKRYKIVLTVGELNNMFIKNPSLVIRYLQLGNKKNKSNQSDRAAHQINIYDYDAFLPKLIKNHIDDFVEFYELMPDKVLKIGHKKTLLFVKNALETLIEKSHLYLKILDLRVVTQKLSVPEFKKMFRNLFPANLSEFRPQVMVDFLKYYPKDDRYALIDDTFKSVYDQSIMDNIELAKLPDILKILPPERRNIYAESLLESDPPTDYADVEFDWTCYMSPTKTYTKFLERIKKQSNLFDRAKLMSKIIYNCKVYENYEYLAMFLEYYNERHKNEQKIVLKTLLDSIVKFIDFRALDKDCWVHLKAIVQRAYVKDELFSMSSQTLETIFQGALYHTLIQSRDQEEPQSKDWYDKIVHLIVEYRIKQLSGSFNYMKEYPELEHELLETFLTLIPEKYPASHKVWDKDSQKITLVTDLFSSMVDFNRRCIRKFSNSSDHHDFTIKLKPFQIKNHTWLQDFTIEIFKTCKNFPKKKKYLKQLLKKFEPEVFNKIIMSDGLLVCSVDTGEALEMLRRNPQEILAKWPEYLKEANASLVRKNINAKQFIKVLKMYQELPIYFLKYAIHPDNIKKDGSILMLGLLLEGEIFSQIISPFVPASSVLDLNKKNSKEQHRIAQVIPRAIIDTNPPVAFEVIKKFMRGDFLSLAIKSLNNLSRRVPLKKVIDFAKQLIMDQKVSIKKHGIRLMIQSLNRQELVNYLREIWSSKHQHRSIKEIVAKKIIELFIDSPNELTWQLISICLDGLNGNEEITDSETFEIAEHLCTCVRSVDKAFVELYLSKLIEIINQLPKTEDKPQEKVQEILIQNIFLFPTALPVNSVSEKTWKSIFDKYFYNPKLRRASQSIQRFVIEQYLPLSESEDHLILRLKEIINQLQKIIHDRNASSFPKKPRMHPANFYLRFFFDTFFKEIPNYKHAYRMILLLNMAKLFQTFLLPQDDPETYLMLQFYNAYLSNPEPKTFGFNCASKLATIVSIFKTDLVLKDVADCLLHIIVHEDRDCNRKLQVLEGLMEGDEHYGSLVGINLLAHSNIRAYDSTYDRIIQRLQTQKDHVSLQYSVNKFLNNVDLFGCGEY